MKLVKHSGTDIASAYKKVLEKVAAQKYYLIDFIIWSDSFISNAPLHFLKEYPGIQSVTMKYCVPGHSCCQEVDIAHSLMEKAMNKSEVYSPLGLERVLKQINRSIILFRAIQFQKADIFFPLPSY
ncbi:hypothetical protein C0J52_27065 [Blattella germanica]|nr:hypothetical protein C0J52_27065 [Blattella germanica]